MTFLRIGLLPCSSIVQPIVRYNRFLNAQRVFPAEIHRQLMEVYGEGVTNDGKVCKWCRLLNEGRMNVHDGERSP